MRLLQLLAALAFIPAIIGLNNIAESWIEKINTSKSPRPARHLPPTEEPDHHEQHLNKIYDEPAP
jgi:hypothetical protein